MEEIKKNLSNHLVSSTLLSLHTFFFFVLFSRGLPLNSRVGNLYDYTKEQPYLHFQGLLYNMYNMSILFSQDTFRISDGGVVASLEFYRVPKRSIRKHCTKGCTLSIIQGIHTR